MLGAGKILISVSQSPVIRQLIALTFTCSASRISLPTWPRIIFAACTWMIGGKRLHTFYRINNQLRRGVVHRVPAGVIVFADWLREMRVGRLRSIELAFEHDEHRIAVARGMLFVR